MLTTRRDAADELRLRGRRHAPAFLDFLRSSSALSRGPQRAAAPPASSPRQTSGTALALAFAINVAVLRLSGERHQLDGDTVDGILESRISRSAAITSSPPAAISSADALAGSLHAQAIAFLWRRVTPHSEGTRPAHARRKVHQCSSSRMMERAMIRSQPLTELATSDREGRAEHGGEDGIFARSISSPAQLSVAGEPDRSCSGDRRLPNLGRRRHCRRQSERLRLRLEAKVASLRAVALGETALAIWRQFERLDASSSQDRFARRYITLPGGGAVRRFPQFIAPALTESGWRRCCWGL
jgi:hypothetical protein